jgi:hypothetical protein
LIADSVTLVLENLPPIQDKSKAKEDLTALGAPAICTKKVVILSRTTVRFRVGFMRLWFHASFFVSVLNVFLPQKAEYIYRGSRGDNFSKAPR